MGCVCVWKRETENEKSVATHTHTHTQSSFKYPYFDVFYSDLLYQRNCLLRSTREMSQLLNGLPQCEKTWMWNKSNIPACPGRNESQPQHTKTETNLKRVCLEFFFPPKVRMYQLHFEKTFIKNVQVLEGWDGEGGGREVQEWGDICIPMADLCWSLAETNTILYSNYLSIKK